MNNDLIFKYSELTKFLMYIKEKYHVTNMRDWNGSKSIILRHDIDFDLKAAYDLSLIEKEIDVPSTFYIMTSSLTYNALSHENRKIIQKISDMGFEVGLHFDPTIYGQLEEKELQQKVDQESKILSFITKIDVRSISIHNPSVHGKYPIFEKYLNAYDDKIFSNDKYISDSRMSFSTNIYEFVKNASKSPIQILLHPMYYTKEGLSLPAIFCRFVHLFIKQIDVNYRVNSTYNELMTTDLFTYMLENGCSHES